MRILLILFAVCAWGQPTPAENVSVVMSGFSRALGVECTHCHVEGAMDRDAKPAFAKSRRMVQMRNWIAQNTRIESTCWTCHRGHAVPEKGPTANPPVWPAELNLTTEQNAEPAAKDLQEPEIPEFNRGRC